MKTNKNKIWKTGVIAGMLAMLVLAFSACGSEPEESSTAEAKATTTTTVTTEATTTTTETTTTTKKTTTETSESTTAEATTTAATAEAKKEPEKGTAVAEPVVDKPKATTAKPASPTPVKKTTAAAPKGHYETIHHEAVTQQVWVEDSPAGEKTIFQCRCGLRLNSFDEYVAHSSTLLDNYNEHCTYEFWYEEVPAQGHYETQVIQAAYDEQVWVQD
ncbi:hypothetical protein [Ruminococcus sp.]|uniref:hypothetical protein n=1 Tax=Ruminococcus sp. TaxID=41978 RepID=UPI003993BDDC